MMLTSFGRANATRRFVAAQGERGRRQAAETVARDSTVFLAGRSPMLKRWRSALFVGLTIAIGGCGAAGVTTATSPTAQTLPSAVAVSPAATPSPTPAPTPEPSPLPTLASTTKGASKAPAGAISIRMTAVDAGPRFQPDNITARAGTVVFFLENVPGTHYSPDHNMQIGPASVQFFGDGSIRSGQVLAGTPHIGAKQEAIFTVNDLTPGSYLFWCSVEAGNGNHAAFGMVGTLTITP